VNAIRPAFFLLTPASFVGHKPVPVDHFFLDGTGMGFTFAQTLQNDEHITGISETQGYLLEL
jgi:hypothetical protein